VTRPVVRLLVPSPDGRRVLARPNGLAGWALPAVPVSDHLWTEEDLAAAARIVGAAVRPVREVVEGTWEVEALGRVPATRITWISPDESPRLGPDAAAVLRWAAADEG
jgi:hypothetical protein